MNCYRINPSHFARFSHPPGFTSKSRIVDNSQAVTDPQNQLRNQQPDIAEVQPKDIVKLVRTIFAPSETNNKCYEQQSMKKLHNYKNNKYENNNYEKVKNNREPRELGKKRILAIRLDTPDYWGLNTFDAPHLKVDIRPGSPEFVRISRLLNTTIGTHDNKFGTIYGKDPTKFIVTKITRIHNQNLWHAYCFKKNSIIQKSNNRLVDYESSEYLQISPLLTPLLDAAANEYYLFHGCDYQILKHLLYSGYDPRVSNLHGMLGGGFYLAENSSKCNQYIPCPGCGKNSIPSGSGCNCPDQEDLVFSIILYRAILGDVHIAKMYDRAKYCGGSMDPVRRPPTKENGCDLYDSVLGESIKHGGNKLRHREVILYESGQAYAEYVIQFKRWAVNARMSSSAKSVEDKCVQS
ncbi:unnamed protein product [Didymodactylos carnosus]|uniref:Poly [ADP-ribose] polymerase n=2 Tax=Didymodactylos carnosus TaxID=1234261 RepID=A0A8S2MY29_9BILA|nr:unnamed protein product [Didymodactylos carnosus]CAF3971070.1 unnamed protein product [Didymodactylos carnosus]